MAQLNFFAAHNDQVAILDFLYSETDVRIFESYSEHGQELKEFRSTTEVIKAFSLGNTTSDKSKNNIHFLLTSQSVSGEPVIRRIELDSKKCKGHTFRYSLDGGALIQLYFGGVHKNDEQIITASHLGHNSQTRAENWGVAENIDWDALKKLSNKIRYHIEKRLAVAKVPGCPVLPHAFDLVQQGYILRESVQSPWQYEAPVLIRI